MKFNIKILCNGVSPCRREIYVEDPLWKNNYIFLISEQKNYT